jgi:hypothetical protein
MAEATLFEQDQTDVTTDDDTGWLDVGDANYLDLELSLSKAAAAAGGAVAITLTLEGQEADDDVTTLWETVADGPGWTFTESFGPDTDHQVVLPPSVRLRWALLGGTATFSASLTSR